MEHISVRLWNALNILIGTKEQVFIRRRTFDLSDCVMKQLSREGERYFSSGSKAEGLCLSGSDADMMLVLNKISVTENPTDLNSDLIIDTKDIKPGFVKLRFLHDQINSAMLTHEDMFVSSLLFRDMLVKESLKKFPDASAHGPCVTYKTATKLEIDRLSCFSCNTWPRIATEWINRERQNNWPPPYLIQFIVQDGCLLVPIGNPNSQESHIQWRISFSLAEKKLVFSFNHTQLLCYGLLKLFLKHVINSNVEVKDLLCSYFLKTSLFYCIEEENIVWNKENFLDCFWTCVRRLLKWVRDEYCPNYFIKDNNMFEGKVCGRKGKALLNYLSKLYNDGLDSLKLIPRLSSLSRTYPFDIARIVRTDPIPLSNELREYVCDSELFLHTVDISLIDCDEMKQLNDAIFQMMQQTTHSMDRVILTIMSFNMMCFMVPSVYMDIQTTRSLKRRYKQIKGLKRFIINNCFVGDVCTGRLMLATLCYLSGDYKEVVIIVQKVLKEFKSHTIYCSASTRENFDANQLYIDTMCGKGLTLNQKLAQGIVANSFLCHIPYNFYPQEIEPELIKYSLFRRTTSVPPVLYGNILVFLSYYHMGCKVQMNYTLHKLHLAVRCAQFIHALERPLANALFQKCLYIFENR